MKQSLRFVKLLQPHSLGTLVSTASATQVAARVIRVGSRSMSSSASSGEKDVTFVAGVRIAHQQNAYWQNAGDIIKDNTFNGVKDIFETANRAEQRIPEFTPNSEYVGTMLQRSTNEAGKSVLTKIEHDHTLKADVVILMGMDTCDVAAGQAIGLKGFSELLLGTSDPKEIEKQGKMIISYFPESSRAERYKQGLFYLANENHVDENAKIFTGKYILPRFLDENHHILPPEKVKPFVFATYSLGAREAAMVENALIYMFRSAGLKSEQIQPYLDRYMRLNLGYAVNWEHASDKPTSKSFSVLSLSDMGSRKTSSLMNAVYYNSDVSTKATSTFYRSAPHKEWLCVLGDHQVPALTMDRNGKYKLNPLGHGIEGYLAVKEHMEKSGILPIVTSFLQQEGQEVIAAKENALAAKSVRFDPYIKVTEINQKERQVEWSKYLHKQDVEKRKLIQGGKKPSELSGALCNTQVWQKYLIHKKANNNEVGPTIG